MHQYQRVILFHDRFGLPILVDPSIPDIKRVELRLRLIREEFEEVEEEFKRIQTRYARYERASDVYEDIARLAKELSDLRWVCYGTDVEFGIPTSAVDSEVARSNMSKLWDDGKPRHRHDGKVLKPPTYSEADILSALGIIEGDITP